MLQLAAVMLLVVTIPTFVSAQTVTAVTSSVETDVSISSEFFEQQRDLSSTVNNIS